MELSKIKEQLKIREQIFEKIESLNPTELVCNCIIGSFLMDSAFFISSGSVSSYPSSVSDKKFKPSKKYPVGSYDKKTIYVDPNRTIDDLTITDENGNLLLDLTNENLDIDFYL